MGWNHRVLAHIQEDGEVFFMIHEVYYTEGEPYTCTKEGTPVSGENLFDILWAIDKMKECLDKPILMYDDLSVEYEE